MRGFRGGVEGVLGGGIWGRWPVFCGEMCERVVSL